MKLKSILMEVFPVDLYQILVIAVDDNFVFIADAWAWRM